MFFSYAYTRVEEREQMQTRVTAHVCSVFPEISLRSSTLGIYSRIMGRFLGLRRRIGRRFRNRRHFQSKQ